LFPKAGAGKTRLSSSQGLKGKDQNPLKKVKIVANPLIKEDGITVKGTATVAYSSEMIIPPPIDPTTGTAANKGSAKHPLEKRLRIIDNKKHPLAYYKGAYNRVMRTARNISSNSGVPDYTKKYTSEPLGTGMETDSISIMTKQQPTAAATEMEESASDLSDLMVVSDAEGSSDVDQDVIDELARKYTSAVDDPDYIEDPEDLEDDEDDDPEEDEDEDDVIDNEDAVGDDDDDNESSGVEYSE